MMVTVFVLGVVVLGTYSRFSKVYGGGRELVVYGLSFAIPGLLPFITLSNELNAVHWLPYEPIHNFLARVFVVLCAAWVVIQYQTLSATYA
jgi:hypothetical protein